MERNEWKRCRKRPDPQQPYKFETHERQNCTDVLVVSAESRKILAWSGKNGGVGCSKTISCSFACSLIMRAFFLGKGCECAFVYDTWFAYTPRAIRLCAYCCYVLSLCAKQVLLQAGGPLFSPISLLLVHHLSP